MRSVRRRPVVLMLSLLALAPAGSASPQAPAGTTRVIVTLKTAVVPEAALAPAEIDLQRRGVGDLQERVLAAVGNARAATGHRAPLKSITKFKFTPALALEADAATLAALLAHPDVAAIVEDRRYYPIDSESAPLIGMDPLVTAGEEGAGQVVAIIDSGVDSSHWELDGKIVSEACYTSGACPPFVYDPNLGLEVGTSASTAPGSGAMCPAIFPGCEHGTMVASVAAGRGVGVAPAANILAIRVAEGLHDTGIGLCRNGAPRCVLMFESSVLAALERVYELRNDFRIAAVNLSLGDDQHHTMPCDGGVIKTMIDNLRAAGIPTVIASGNSAMVDTPAGRQFQMGIGSPACVSTALSVGSVGDGTVSPYAAADQVSEFSQAASYLSLLAPGESINVATPGGGYQNANGTSLAAPHVTGAIAALKSHAGPIPVTQVLRDLRGTGKVIDDYRADLAFPRIDAGAAASLYPSLAQNRPVTSNGILCAAGQEDFHAVNGLGTDKWCAWGGTWLEIDLGRLQRLKTFVLHHAESQGEFPEYNTRDFTIQVSLDGTHWKTVSTTTGNTAPITHHTLGTIEVARYVKLNITNAGIDGATRLYEFLVLGAGGSDTNLALDKTATSTALCDSEETPAHALNGSTTGGHRDKWCSNPLGGGQWLKVDLGTMALVDRFVVKHANINKSEVDGYNTRDFDIEVSADGSAWTRVVAVTGNTKDVTAHVTAPISARWVRLNVVNGGIDGVARIYEFEVYGTPGTNQARGRSTKGSTSCTSAQSSAKAVDGRVDSGDAKWCSGASSKYVQVDLGSARTVKWIVLKHAGVRESASLNTRSFRILVSSDLTTWRTVSTITGNTESVTTHPITPTSARYVKVEVVTPAQTSDTRARIYEMEVYK